MLVEGPILEIIPCFRLNYIPGVIMHSGGAPSVATGWQEEITNFPQGVGGGGWEALIFLGTKRTYEALRATQFLR